jgi:cobalt-zinc-cadmium efflux system membrane fusion protein
MKALKVTIIVLLVVLNGCREKTAAPPPAETEKADDAALVTIKPNMLERLKIAPVTEGEIGEALRMPARVEIDRHRIARIGATVTGRVVRVSAVLGQPVKRGESLASLNSTELSEAQLAYLKASSRKRLHQRIAERARHLYESGVISEMELQKRESEYVLAETELHAAANELKILGMADEAIDRLATTRVIHSSSPVIATSDGTIIERNIALGQVVQPADVLFTVADLSHVWLVAEVPEQQAESVRAGKWVEAEIPALSNRRIEGKLIYVSHMVDPKTRTLQVRMEVANVDGSIKPEMLATMLIKDKSRRVALVPARAVVRDGNEDYVFVQLDDHRFQLQSVTLGKEVGSFFPVVDGVKIGDRIVADGAFHLNNERLRRELE